MKNTLAAATLGILVCLSAGAQDTRGFLLGGPAVVAEAQRTIVVNADTQWVNVMQGETVRFVSGNAEFAWKFDGPGARSLDLRQIAPGGILSKAVKVYVAATGGHRTN